MSTNLPSNSRNEPVSKTVDDLIEADEYIPKRRQGSVEEAIEELQAGEVVGHMGFVPHKFVDDYLFRKTDEESIDRAKKIDDIAQSIIDRLIVVSPTQTSGPSLQMKLVQSAFDGSEIWFKRQKDEILIEFKASTDESYEFLSSRNEELTRKISDSLKIAVSVNVAKNDAEKFEGY